MAVRDWRADRILLMRRVGGLGLFACTTRQNKADTQSLQHQFLACTARVKNPLNYCQQWAVSFMQSSFVKSYHRSAIVVSHPRASSIVLTLCTAVFSIINANTKLLHDVLHPHTSLLCHHTQQSLANIFDLIVAMEQRDMLLDDRICSRQGLL